MRAKLLIIFLFLAFSRQSYADNEETQGQDSFPFDRQCLTFDQANFKVGSSLLSLMKEGDFPQYCVLYSLSDYQIKEKNAEGYLIAGVKSKIGNPQISEVILKSKISYKPNQILKANGSASKPAGQWVYFTGPEEIAQEDGTEKEIYTFQEIDF